MNEIIKSLYERKSVRAYEDRPISGRNETGNYWRSGSAGSDRRLSAAVYHTGYYRIRR